MIKFVDFVSASKIESMRGDPSWAVVSITDPGSSDARIASDFGPVLHLKFDDLDDDSLSSGSTGRVFTMDDAQTVHCFLYAVHRDSQINGVIIHCEMGRSRSGAITWYALAFGGEMLNERRIDGYNSLVLRMLERSIGIPIPNPTGMIIPAGTRISVQ